MNSSYPARRFLAARCRPAASVPAAPRLAAAFAFALGALLAGCAAPSSPRAPAAPRPSPPAVVKVSPPAPPPVAAPLPAPEPEPVPSPPLAIGPEATSLSVVAGRSIVDVFVPGSSFVSLGVFGPRHALLGFDVIDVLPAPPPDTAPGAGEVLAPDTAPGSDKAPASDTAPGSDKASAPDKASASDKAPASAAPAAPDPALLQAALASLRARRPLDEDSLLPRIVSFRSPPVSCTVRILVDAAEPVDVQRVATAAVDVERLPEKGKRYRPAQAPSIGFPLPETRDEGYFLQSPARYQFARADVIASLLVAFRRTRARFRRDPIAIADISQWDNIRPATDLGHPRHISHEGGRDVDIALAASDELPSTVRAHCTGVLVEEGVQGCGPGTVRGFDASRTAYFLGILFETAPPVEKIFIDDVYLREVRKAAEKLHQRRLLKDVGLEGLSDDAIVRPSPWHTDHFHVRFAGPPGKAAF